jgi:putative ABC transport system substrate-binding protein
MRSIRLSRRRFVALMAALGLPQRGLGQPKKVYRVGWPASVDNLKEPYGLAFVDQLRRLGFAEGDNLVLIHRHAEGTVERLPAIAAEVAKLNCDVLFGAGAEATLGRVDAGEPAHAYRLHRRRL